MLRKIDALEKKLWEIQSDTSSWRTSAAVDAEMPPVVEDTAAISTRKAKIDRIAKACADYADYAKRA